MEDEQDCGYDYIQVFDGFDDSGNSYGKFCGNKVRRNCEQIPQILLNGQFYPAIVLAISNGPFVLKTYMRTAYFIVHPFYKRSTQKGQSK